MVDELRRFGKYLLLDHLVDGGMGAIYRARELAESADKMVADKVVAVKVIKEQHSQDESFRDMFLDEIKVAFGLIHPNISQTYNYGEINKQLFTVMEYVDGKNLKEFCDILKTRRKYFPIECSLHIIMQSCQGLDYAHKFTDKLSGQTQHLVHRDISPHNIMMDYDGIVKVIDFGIAKAESNTESTRTGTIKGKVSYIAPEYLMEELEIDARYDQFAIGLTLWELLTGERLFTGKNDMTILKSIYDCNIPKPRTINPNIPVELEEILLKSLSRDRNNRYEDMDKLNRALGKFLHTKYPDFGPSDLALFLHEEFKDTISANNQKLIGFGKVDVAPYFKELKEEMQHKPEAYNPPKPLGGSLKDKIKEGGGADKKKSWVDGRRKSLCGKLVFGSTSMTDNTDKMISPFILKRRQEAASNKK